MDYLDEKQQYMHDQMDKMMNTPEFQNIFYKSDIAALREEVKEYRAAFVWIANNCGAASFAGRYAQSILDGTKFEVDVEE